jgi:hypothetical protein
MEQYVPSSTQFYASMTERPVALPIVLQMGVAVVPAYSVFFLESDTYITQPPQIFECTDDQEAIETAKQFIDGRDIELWAKSGCIVRFARTPGK